MSNNPSELTRVVSEVLEDFCMMMVEPLGPQDPFAPQLEGTIGFTGPVSGQIVLRCPESLAQAVAANLLGTTEMDLASQTNAWDALAELLNIVCGNVTTRMFDAEKPFTLSIPQINIIHPASAGDPVPADAQNSIAEPGSRDQETIRLLLDGKAAEFTLITTRRAAENVPAPSLCGPRVTTGPA